MAGKPPILLSPHSTKPAYLSAEYTNISSESSSQLESVYTEIDDIRKALLLSEVIEHHSERLPMVVQLKDSIYGLGDSLTLCDGDLLSLHFLKKTDCVTVQARRRPKRSIPINSTLQFSALYNPTDSEVGEAKQGVVFKSVSSLMSTTVPPRVVCVTGVPASQNPCSLIAEGDILILKDVKRKKDRSSHMTCHHMQRRLDVELKECWDIQFSTNPELLKLHLPKLLDHISLPIEVVVSMQDKALWKGIKMAFPKQVCTLLSRNVEASVIATYNSRKGAAHSVLEIPVNYSLLSCSIFQMSPAIKHQLEKKTQLLLRTFVPATVDSMITDDVSANCSLLLRKYVCQTNPNLGITLIKPGGLDNEYESVELNLKNQEMTNPKVSTGKIQGDSGAQLDQSSRKEVFNDDDANYYTAMDPISSTLGSTWEHESSYTTISSSPLTQHDAALSANQKALTSLTCDQVLMLLDSMGLGIYKEPFKREKITGDLMLELDDSMLRDELGVKLQIHRIRIMKVIKGQHSLAGLVK